MTLNNNIFAEKKEKKKNSQELMQIDHVHFTVSCTDRSVDSKGRVIYKSIVSVDG